MSTAAGGNCVLTVRQRRAVMGEFDRLGLAHPAWRPQRLLIAAALAGRPALRSVNELTTGEAGRMFRLLQQCQDCRDLAVLLAAQTSGEQSRG